MLNFANVVRSRLTEQLHPCNHYNLPVLFCPLYQKRRFLNFEVKALCPLFKFFTVLTLFLFFFCPFCPFLGKVCWIPPCMSVCVCGCVFFLPLCSCPQCNTPFTEYYRLMASVKLLPLCFIITKPLFQSAHEKSASI